MTLTTHVFDWAQVKLSQECIRHISKSNSTNQHVMTELANAGGVTVIWEATGMVTLEGSWKHILKSQTVFEDYVRSCLEDSKTTRLQTREDLAAKKKSIIIGGEMDSSFRYAASTEIAVAEENEVYVNITLSSTEYSVLEPKSIQVVNNNHHNNITESTLPNETQSENSPIYNCEVSSFERSLVRKSEPISSNLSSVNNIKVQESVYNLSNQQDTYNLCNSEAHDCNFRKSDGIRKRMLLPNRFSLYEDSNNGSRIQDNIDRDESSGNVSLIATGDTQSLKHIECFDSKGQPKNMSLQFVCVDRSSCITSESSKMKQKYLKKKDYEELAPFKFFCSLCSFKSKRESHFSRHMKLHGEVSDLFKCNQCNFTSIRLSHLRRHELNHSNLTFACSECRYRTNSQKLLVRHKRIKHGTKKIPEIKSDVLHCVHCEYQTSRYHFLQRHMRVHVSDASSVRVYQCEQCSYKTNRKEHYVRHTNNIHKEQRPFLCDLCGKAFKRQDALKQHSVIHATEPAVTCPECGKGCRSQTHLSQHMSVHSSDRSFLCELCGASFKTRAVQRKHMFTIHQHPKAFLCSHCSRKFSTKFALRRHIKQHSFLEKRPNLQDQKPSAPVFIPDISDTMRFMAMDTVYLSETTTSHTTPEQNITPADASREGEKITLQFTETVMQPNKETALVYLTGTFTPL